MKSQAKWILLGVVLVPGWSHAIGKVQLRELYGAARPMRTAIAHGRTFQEQISDRSKYKAMQISSNRGGHTEAYVPKSNRGTIFISRHGLGGERWYKVAMPTAKR